MLNWLDRPLVWVALVLSAVLVLVGMRRIAAMRAAGRQGVFWSALAFFLAAGACDASKAGISAGDPSAGGGENATESKALNLPPEFASPEKWKAMRAFWKRLAASGRKVSDPAPAPVMDFGGQLTHSEREALGKELAAVLGCSYEGLWNLKMDASEAGSGSGEGACRLSLPTQVLAHAALARITALGPDNTMMMHMLPPPDMIYRNRIRARLQHRFELMVTLRSEGKMSDEEFKSALDRLEEQVYQLAVFETARVVVGPAAGHMGPLEKKGLYDADSNMDFLAEAKAWVDGAQAWCATEQHGLVAEPSRKEDLERVKGVCASMNRTFEELARIRPQVRRLMEELEGAGGG